MLVYPAMKQLTLDLAATSFLGAGIGPEVDEITRAFVDMVAASVAVIRKPLPGTRWRAASRAASASSPISPSRSRSAARKGGGDDLFSQLCQATHEDGALLSTQDIVDHMSFLMMAAHDTLTSSLTSFVGELAAHPEWQQQAARRSQRPRHRGRRALQLRQSRSHAADGNGVQGSAAAEAAGAVDAAPRGARLHLQGLRDPAGTMVGVNPLFTHHMPEIWPEPEKFDPMRFTDEAQRNRHRFAWVPYGGGAHMCLGLHFAYMQAKCFARHFLQNLEVSLEPGYKPDWQMWPIPKPRDGLRVVLKAV